MAKKPKKKGAAAQGRHRPKGDFGLAALREVTAPHAFTMQDEARNTGHRSSLWAGDTRLRARPVGFVSAGLIQPLKDESQNNADELSSEEAVEAGSSKDALPGDTTVEMPKKSPDLTKSPALAPALATTTTAEIFDGANEARGPDVPAFIIDVVGDKTLATKVTASTPHIPDPQSSADESDSSSEVILFKGRNAAATAFEAPKSRTQGPVTETRTEKSITLGTIRYEIKAAETKSVDLPDAPAKNRFRPGVQSRRQEKLPKFQDSDDEEAAIIADYIANMAEDSDDPSPHPLLRDLGGEDGDFVPHDSGSSSSQDDNDASDDDEETENVITGDGRDSDGDELADPTMDDETLARLLGKQEELGLGSDELILVSDDAFVHSKRRGKGKAANTGARGAFPSASAMADAFDDLDLMDWERPSLNQRKRGRRGQPPVFGLSDSEMEEKLQTAWINDREAKKSRKMRREELRSQGLLGKHANPDDIRHKYPTGMTLDDIKTELGSFLKGSEERLELPPMDKSARKTLHELARKFKVKSQSTGSGNQRRPTLIRTKYTARYTEEHLEVAMSNVGRKYFARMDVKVKGKGLQKKAKGGGAGSSAVTYRDGEVVGASAPELGVENKGRTMLEKMGWSSGMGLGSLDNKGILQPVPHVVKRTKAGLG